MTSEYLEGKKYRVIKQADEKGKINRYNIYDGITIDDKEYAFEEMIFFDGRLKIHLPTEFVNMSTNSSLMNYQSGEHSPIVKTNDFRNVNITLNLIPNNICDDQIAKAKDDIKIILKRQNPSYFFFKEGVEIIGDKPVGFFEFKSPTMDASMFNLIFLAELDRNIMMGTFNCSYSDFRQWHPVAWQIMRSLKIKSATLDSGNGFNVACVGG